MEAQVWSIIGGQAGSEGKGKAAAYIADREQPDIVACAFTANAGHTAYTRNGEKIVVHTVPLGAFFAGRYAVIGPGAAINLERLIEEAELLHYINPDCEIIVDPHAVVITEDQVAWETERMKRISSTCQGVGRAQADRLLRNGSAKMAESMVPFYLQNVAVGPVAEFLQAQHKDGARIQLEGCQGLDIDILHGIQYPYTTSRSITAAAVANDIGFPASRVDAVVGVFRTYPIRVGNVYDEAGNRIGWSGPIPVDSREISWDEITKMSGSPEPLIERTTVTKKVRRIFTWSKIRYAFSMWINDITHVWLNFGDYVDWNLHGVGGNVALLGAASNKMSEWGIQNIGASHGSTICAVGTGPGMDEIFAPNPDYSFF